MSAQQEPQPRQARSVLHHIGNFRVRLENIKRENLIYRLGLDGPPGADDWFIPASKVKSYLLAKRYIEGLLQDVGISNPSLKVDWIFDHYAIVFCILIHIGAERYISQFIRHGQCSDEQLPFFSMPSFLDLKAWDSFSKVQWHFKPQFLHSDAPLNIDKRAIIPFLSRTELARGTTGVIYRVKLHREYDKLSSQKGDKGKAKSPRPDDPHKEYAVKVYRGRQSLQYFETESSVFDLIKGDRRARYPTGIIEYLGAYQYDSGEQCCILLELAIGRTLKHMFDNESPPHDAEDIRQFWLLMFELLDGLTKLHELSNLSEQASRRITQCIHHDIHPENIVLIPHDQPPSEHPCLQYRFVLADLGHATTLEVANTSTEASVISPKAGLEYAAPEASPASARDEDLRDPVTSAVDIWALGAVMLVAVIWIAQGPSGVAEFARHRETQSQGYPVKYVRFHSGEYKESVLLDVVEQNIKDGQLRKHIDRSDHMTLRVLDQMVVKMLRVQPHERPAVRTLLRDVQDVATQTCGRPNQPPTISVRTGESSSDRVIESSGQLQAHDGRPHASQTGRRLSAQGVKRSFETVFKVPDKQSDAQIPLQPLTSGSSAGSPSSQRHKDMSPVNQEEPPVTIAEVLQHKHNYENMSAAHRMLRPPPQLRHMYKQEHLLQRDFVFLVDNCATMRDHHHSLLEALSAMLYVIEGKDKDGIELYFTNDMELHRESKAKHILSLVRQATYTGSTDMKGSLTKILAKFPESHKRRRSYIRPLRQWSPQGTSVYVLTDGKWEEDNDAKTVILDTVRRLTVKGCSRFDLCISLITFGADQGGLVRMKELDDLPRRGYPGILDIVDTESNKGRFWKILLGALDADEDEDEPPSPEVAATQCAKPDG